MPTYEYSCQKCGKTVEIFQSMKDAPLTICRCGKKGRIKRLPGRGAGIIFKGSGFYETDYRRRPAKADKGKADVDGKAKPASPAPATPAAGPVPAPSAKK